MFLYVQRKNYILVFYCYNQNGQFVRVNIFTRKRSSFYRMNGYKMYL